MPLQEIAFPYLPSRVATKNLNSNNKLLTDEEINAIINDLKDKPNGRYRKEVFNRVQMRNNTYGIIKHQDDYFAIYSKCIYKFANVKVKAAQNLRTGEWLRLKVHTNKLEAENEFNYLAAADRQLAITYFSRQSRKHAQVKKYYILTNIKAGVDLNEFIQMGKHISPTTCLELAIDILKKVKAIHDEGYLLCKLTTDNILCTAENNAIRISDFDSISKMNERQQAEFPITSSDIFLAPEIFDEYTFISLLSHVERTLARGDKVTRDKLVEMLDDPKFFLSKLRSVKKTTLIKNFCALTAADRDRLRIKSNASERITYTFSQQTDFYTVGTILKVLFNIPVEEINKNAKNEAYFTIGQAKNFVEHGPIGKWLDGMTAKHPEARNSIADALAFFEDYYKSILPLTHIRVGIIDIDDFSESIKVTTLTDGSIPVSMSNGFWRDTFSHLIQKMDEIYIVSKRRDYTDKNTIQRGLVRLGVLYHKDLIITPTLTDLLMVTEHIKEKHPNRDVHSFTYFDFSNYSRPENSFYTLPAVKENGIGSPVNGHHTNGHAHRQLEIYLTPPQGPLISPPPEPQPVPQRIVMTADKVNETLKNSGINVISIDVKKNFPFYAPLLAQCLTTVTAAQFEILNFQINSAITNYETQKYIHPDANNKIVRLRSALSRLTSLKEKNALSYAIAHATLDVFVQLEKTQPTSRFSGLFTRTSVFEKLHDELKMPEESRLSHQSRAII